MEELVLSFCDTYTRNQMYQALKFKKCFYLSVFTLRNFLNFTVYFYLRDLFRYTETRNYDPGHLADLKHNHLLISSIGNFWFPSFSNPICLNHLKSKMYKTFIFISISQRGPDVPFWIDRSLGQSEGDRSRRQSKFISLTFYYSGFLYLRNHCLEQCV